MRIKIDEEVVKNLLRVVEEYHGEFAGPAIMECHCELAKAYRQVKSVIPIPVVCDLIPGHRHLLNDHVAGRPCENPTRLFT